VLGSKAVATPDVHFALADRGSMFGVVYPAISTDGGRTWSVDGPCFYYAAAQGANAVSTIEARAPNWAYAWGYGGSYVKSTRDGGAHWFAADFPSSIVQVTTKGDSLVVKLYRTPSRYVSHDYGLTWRSV
jgi:photosystem II stability/assembly factor-like uncharacterized protein